MTVELRGETRQIDLQVRPVHESGTSNNYYLVIFEENSGAEKSSEEPIHFEDTTPHLERELEQMRAQLSTTVEQYEASTEELKASNEELQAINEELRSATEELETGREELQSVNEELITVNSELKTSVEDLARSNSDLQNLIASTDIGTIFLNRELRIKRFTPRIQELFNVIASDIGRPLSDLTKKIDYLKLPADAEKVLRDLIPVETEVRHESGADFLVRIVPYRTSGQDRRCRPHLRRYHRAQGFGTRVARIRGALPRDVRAGKCRHRASRGKWPHPDGKPWRLRDGGLHQGRIA